MTTSWPDVALFAIFFLGACAVLVLVSIFGSERSSKEPRDPKIPLPEYHYTYREKKEK